ARLRARPTLMEVARWIIPEHLGPSLLGQPSKKLPDRVVLVRRLPPLLVERSDQLARRVILVCGLDGRVVCTRADPDRLPRADRPQRTRPQHAPPIEPAHHVERALDPPPARERPRDLSPQHIRFMLDDMLAVQHRSPPRAENSALDRFHMAERRGAS